MAPVSKFCTRDPAKAIQAGMAIRKVDKGGQRAS
jgi:hypothetical protein